MHAHAWCPDSVTHYTENPQKRTLFISVCKYIHRPSHWHSCLYLFRMGGSLLYPGKFRRTFSFFQYPFKDFKKKGLKREWVICRSKCICIINQKGGNNGCRNRIGDVSDMYRSSAKEKDIALHGNPYDDHTLSSALSQVNHIAKLPEHVFVDMGDREHNYPGYILRVINRRRRGPTAKSLWRWMKQRGD